MFAYRNFCCYWPTINPAFLNFHETICSWAHTLRIHSCLIPRRPRKQNHFAKQTTQLVAPGSVELILGKFAMLQTQPLHMCPTISCNTMENERNCTMELSLEHSFFSFNRWTKKNGNKRQSSWSTFEGKHVEPANKTRNREAIDSLSAGWIVAERKQMNKTKMNRKTHCFMRCILMPIFDPYGHANGLHHRYKNQTIQSMQCMDINPCNLRRKASSIDLASILGWSIRLESMFDIGDEHNVDN